MRPSLTKFKEEMALASQRCAEYARHAVKGAERPVIDPGDIAPYLNWIATRAPEADVETHLRLAELAIRTKANEAQAKATQHTLVEDGVMDVDDTPNAQ